MDERKKKKEERKKQNEDDSLNPSHALEHEILRRDRARLVKAAHVDAACERDAEGLRAEYGCCFFLECVFFPGF